MNSCSPCNPCCCQWFLQVFLYIYFPFLSTPVTTLDQKTYSFLCSFTSCSQGQKVIEAICLMSVVLAALLRGYRHSKLSDPSPPAPTPHTDFQTQDSKSSMCDVMSPILPSLIFFIIITPPQLLLGVSYFYIFSYGLLHFFSYLQIWANVPCM